MQPLKKYASVNLSNVDKLTKENEKSVKLCNYTDVYKNWAITNDLEKSFLNASANEKEIAKFLLHKGQVALTKDSETKDDIGISTYIADNFDNVILGYHCALISPNLEKLDGQYLNLLLHTPYARKFFENCAGGSGQRYTLPVDVIKEFPVNLPSIKTQKIIGTFFSNIDRKISINRKISTELESFAKTIYDYWFLQFEFPDANGRPYKSSGGRMVWNEALKREVPEGWVVEEIRKHVSISRGLSYSSEDLIGDGVPMLNLNSFNPNYTYKAEGLKTFSGKYKSDDIIHPYDLVVAVTQQTSIDIINDTDVIGKSILVPDIFDNDVVSSMDVCTVFADDEMNKYYLNMLFKQKFYRKYITGFANGTKIKHLDINGMLDFKFTVPDKSVLNKYTGFAKACEEKKSELQRENRDLAALRDFLLPMLMNGQVTFKDEKECPA